jgi:hypothetical protein
VVAVGTPAERLELLQAEGGAIANQADLGAMQRVVGVKDAVAELAMPDGVEEVAGCLVADLLSPAPDQLDLASWG